MWRRLVSSRVKSLVAPADLAPASPHQLAVCRPVELHLRANLSSISPLSSAFRRHFSSKSGNGVPANVEKEAERFVKDEWEAELSKGVNSRKPEGINEAVYRVSNILMQGEWNSAMEEALENSNIKFSRFLVKEVLESRDMEPSKALSFFRWVDVSGSFKHDGRTFNAMARVLGKDIFLDRFEQIIQEMRSAGYNMEKKTYACVSERFYQDDMIEKAVELYEFYMASSDSYVSWQPCSKLLSKVITSKNVDMNLIFRTVKAYQALESLKRVRKNERSDGVSKAVNKSVVTSYDTEVVDKVCAIVMKEDWSAAVVKLGELNLKLDCYKVKKILEKLDSDPRKAFLFFRWVDEFGLFKHDGKTFNSMANILGKENFVDKFQLIIKEMRSSGYNMEIKTYVTVSARFCQAQMIREAVELFEFAMVGSNKPTEQLCNLVNAIVTAKKLELDLLSRTVKAFTTYRRIVPDIVQRNALEALKSVGKDEHNSEVLKVLSRNIVTCGDIFPDFVQVPDFVYKTLIKEDWTATLEKQIEDLKIKFDCESVQKILEKLDSEPRKALSFFRWIDECGFFKHDVNTYNSMARVLGKKKFVDEFQQILKEMRSAGYKMEIETYDCVSDRFCLVEMIEEAVELFEFAMVDSIMTWQTCSKLLNKIVTSKKLDLITPTVKAYTTQLHFLELLNAFRGDEQSNVVLNGNKEEQSNDYKIDTSLLTHVVRKVVDAKAAGIKGYMIPVSAWIVLRALKWQGFDAYLVGGCVRDLLMQRRPRDFDVVTTASLLEIGLLFKAAKEVGSVYRICLVNVDESVIEVSNVGPAIDPSSLPCKWEKTDYILYMNSWKRDFTVNTLFFDPLSFRIYDYNNGMDDLESRMLRTMIDASESFAADSARILRCVRIAARLDLSLSEEIEDAIPKYTHLLKSLPTHRLMRELNFMLSYGAAVRSINLLQKLKILHVLLPFQAHCLEGGEEKRTSGSVMLQSLFSNMDKLHSTGNPAENILWVGLLAFHTTLVLNPQPSIVVCAIGSLLSCGQWEEAIQYARECEEEPSASSMSDKELAKAVSAFGILVQEASALLVDKGVLRRELGLSSADVRRMGVCIDKAAWKKAVGIFNCQETIATEKEIKTLVKIEMGKIILEVAKKVG